MRVDSTLVISSVILLILFLILGEPDEFNFGGAKWSFENSNDEIISSQTPTSNIQVKDLLSIEGLGSRQKIYALGNKAFVDFTIKDEKKIPYNFSVDWYYNEIRHHGWDNGSNSTEPFYSWYHVSKKGDWKVQVVVWWEYQGKSYSKDEITYLKVV